MNKMNLFSAISSLSMVCTLLYVAPAFGMEEEPVFSATRIELDTGRASGNSSIQAGRAEGWVGGDYDRFAWKAEASREGSRLEDAEAQALYARYLAPFWDLQTGVRIQNKPDSRTYAAVGLRGLAPYAFDVDLALFVRSDGKLFARTRLEYDLLWTNRLIVRPFAFADWSASRIEADNIRRGIETLEIGINTRYEITRAFAPYAELNYGRRYFPVGSVGQTSLRLGLRLLFSPCGKLVVASNLNPKYRGRHESDVF